MMTHENYVISSKGILTNLVAVKGKNSLRNICHPPTNKQLMLLSQQKRLSLFPVHPTRRSHGIMLYFNSLNDLGCISFAGKGSSSFHPVSVIGRAEVYKI